MAKLNLQSEEELILGIDFGTTNSVISFFYEAENDGHIIPIDGKNIFPTAIRFEIDNDKLVPIIGLEAKNGFMLNPESTILSIKSMLDTDNKIKIIIDNNEHILSQIQVCTLIFEFIRKNANMYIQNELCINGEFTGAVITVPANSSDKQKRKTIESAVLAGFKKDNVHLRFEPAAAAIGYSLKITENKKILVYDFGGGTFDGCILSINIKDNTPVVAIESTFGDSNLGGNNIDFIVFDIIYEELKKITNNKFDLFDNDYTFFNKSEKNIVISRLLQLSNNIKEKLSKTNVAKISLIPLIESHSEINLVMEITKENFLNHKRINRLLDSKELFEKYNNKSVHDIINMTMSSVSMCLSKAFVNPDEINEIFLVGGSSLIPEISVAMEKKFGKKPYKSAINPGVGVGLGAAFFANLIKNNKNKNFNFIEKTLHSIGLELSGRRYLEIIKAGVEIPENGLLVEAKEFLMTSVDNVDSMIISIFENVISDKINFFTNENGMKRIGGTTLKGIPKNKSGIEKVKVSFFINKNNVLKVNAISVNDNGLKTELIVNIIN